MGGTCPGCVDIGPPLDNTGESPPCLLAFEDLRPKLDDVSVILFSSGTTGPSKGVELSDRFFQYQLLMMTYDTRTCCLMMMMMI